MLIGHSKEHKILTVLISSAKVKNTELSLGECSLFGRKKKTLEIRVYVGEAVGKERGLVGRIWGITTLNSCLKGSCLVLLVNY